MTVSIKPLDEKALAHAVAEYRRIATEYLIIDEWLDWARDEGNIHAMDEFSAPHRFWENLGFWAETIYMRAKDMVTRAALGLPAVRFPWVHDSMHHIRNAEDERKALNYWKRGLRAAHTKTIPKRH